MKLKELLEEVKLGTDQYKQKKTIEQITESSSISDMLSVSIEKINNPLLNTLLKSSIMKIKAVEEKEYINETFARMKYDSLRKNYHKMIALLEDKKLRESVNEEIIANALAFIKYNLLFLAEKSNAVCKLNTSNYLEEQISNELSLIKENI